MIQIVKGAQLSLDQQARLARHPLGSGDKMTAKAEELL